MPTITKNITAKSINHINGNVFIRSDILRFEKFTCDSCFISRNIPIIITNKIKNAIMGRTRGITSDKEIILLRKLLHI